MIAKIELVWLKLQAIQVQFHRTEIECEQPFIVKLHNL